MVIRSPSSTARSVNSFISILSGTKGTCFLTPVPGPETGLLIDGILARRGMKTISMRNSFKTLDGGKLACGRAGLQVRRGFQLRHFRVNVIVGLARAWG